MTATQTIPVTAAPVAVLLVAEDDGPTLISNQGSNTLWVGDSQAIRITDQNVVPVNPGGYITVDGKQDFYGIADVGKPTSVTIIAGGLNFFLPPSLVTLGGTKVFYQPTAPVQPPAIPVNSLWFDSSTGSMYRWDGATWQLQQFSGQQLIQATTIFAAQLAAGIIYAGIVDGTTIKGATLIGTNASGPEVLCYSGTPAAGNLVAAVSGTAGNDGLTNAVSAGMRISQGVLVLANTSTPAADSAGPVVFGQSNGALQVVDSFDSNLYATEFRLRPVASNWRSNSTSALTVTDLNFSVVSGRIYRVEFFGLAQVSGANATGVLFRFTGPATSYVIGTYSTLQESTTGQQQFSGHWSALGASSSSPSFPAASFVQLRADLYINFSAAGTLQFQILCAAAAQQWDLITGSTVRISPF